MHAFAVENVTTATEDFEVVPPHPTVCPHRLADYRVVRGGRANDVAAVLYDPNVKELANCLHVWDSAYPNRTRDSIVTLACNNSW